jgi:hypothetical protein
LLGFHLKSDKAGRAIGFLERALVSLFVMTGHLEATVFIFAAKAGVLSFRLPTRTAENRKQTVEYMLIGTMISYLVAIVFGYAGKLLIYF